MGDDLEGHVGSSPLCQYVGEELLPQVGTSAVNMAGQQP